MSIVQDLPISKPFVPSEIDRVAAAKAIQAYSPLYLDLLSGGPRLQAVIERLKAIGTVLNLATCKVRLSTSQAFARQLVPGWGLLGSGPAVDAHGKSRRVR